MSIIVLDSEGRGIFIEYHRIVVLSHRVKSPVRNLSALVDFYLELDAMGIPRKDELTSVWNNIILYKDFFASIKVGWSIICRQLFTVTI